MGTETKGHPWFAALYDPINRLGDRKVMGPLRRRTAGAASGCVLEIGAGTGANFPYYQSVERLVATDLDPFMLRRATKRAQEMRLDVELCRCAAESLPFAGASFDTVVATLVFCSVTDQARALMEVRRVLKPDGAFRFIEHVRADDGFVAHLQDLLTPAWRRLGAGCHLNRSTLDSIRAADLRIVETQRLRSPMPLLPFVTGLAVPG
ncbi:MAG: class I SAM-dependent methyltransferase [Chloroflexi bacterium]|nr:class I SAM-dependent methyltransferase [Chloroflexota bacterium]